ncbi:MAG: hypothetical protein IPN90_01250 [Elusimicrobia bacterium]|nr:hypothetical protein [Elusimicrobiota bacterium]
MDNHIDIWIVNQQIIISVNGPCEGVKILLGRCADIRNVDFRAIIEGETTGLFLSIRAYIGSPKNNKGVWASRTDGSGRYQREIVIPREITETHNIWLFLLNGGQQISVSSEETQLDPLPKFGMDKRPDHSKPQGKGPQTKAKPIMGKFSKVNNRLAV